MRAWSRRAVPLWRLWSRLRSVVAFAGLCGAGFRRCGAFVFAGGCQAPKQLAERGGFEPPVGFKGLRRFSKPLLSTTQPPLRLFQADVFLRYHTGLPKNRFSRFDR